MTNKEIIENKLKELTKDDNNRGIDATTIAEILQIKRNIVSLYLNELVKENKAIKSNSRPVYFRYNFEIANEKKIIESTQINIGDVFKEVVGYNGSLKKEIELCKTAVYYPNNGLPMMVIGESGVGKSYLAEIVYRYAVDEGVIEKNAPFKIFNCADYANNQELLSANLFGYKKGAYTGAECDTKGILELSNGGFLFLDEVHRLSAEGQEKLFIFLDKGIFRRVGSTQDR
ncbi:MAG: sigma 54-interacting transcriptional regulator, partial [Clostridium sp.]|uniref:sigma 54-interacting transcriptional regulator n=1 Tax=Clostridium sp. TaxID=1506 RepID=UPI00290F3ECD